MRSFNFQSPGEEADDVDEGENVKDNDEVEEHRSAAEPFGIQDD